jgi:hypothetical protein
MRTLALIAGAAAISATAALALPASATPAAPTLPLVIDQQANNIETVAQRRIIRRHYDRRFHGPRYRFRHGNYRYRYGGWWYASPWWYAGPTVGLTIAPGVAYGGSDAHVEWCLDRYRSYDPESDTFLGYDGYRHPCNSPY